MERHQKLHGQRLVYEERTRKRQAHLVHKRSKSAQKVPVHGLRAKLYKGKAGKWEAQIPKVKPVADDEMFKATRTGSMKGVGDNFKHQNLRGSYVLPVCE